MEYQDCCDEKLDSPPSKVFLVEFYKNNRVDCRQMIFLIFSEIAAGQAQTMHLPAAWQV
jgi:hypothetical protein